MHPIKTTLFILFVFSTLALNAQNSNKALFNVKDYGATGQKEDYQQNALQQAIDACHNMGGGTVYFPPGDYLTGEIKLKDNVGLHLETGATIWASRKEEHYRKQEEYEVDNQAKTPNMQFLISAEKVENISITGRGMIHGQAEHRYEEPDKIDGFIEWETKNAQEAGVTMKRYLHVQPQPRMIFFDHCKNILIKDVTMKNSQDWTLHLGYCQNINIEGVQIYSSLEKGINADGLDIDGCKDVTVSNCHIETGDDAVVLKTANRFGEAESCENVTVSNCVLASTSSALKLGTESYADFKFITMNNCVIRNTNRGLGIFIRDGGTAENIIFSNIVMELDRKHYNWWGDADPIRFVLLKRFPDSKLGQIKNVLVENVIAHGQGTSRIAGHEQRNIENITLSNVQFFMYPEDKPDKRADYALESMRVDGLKLYNVSVDWDKEQTEEKWSSALYLEDITDLRINELTARQGLEEGEEPVVQLKNVRQALIRNSQALPGSSTFFDISGERTENVRFQTIYGEQSKKTFGFDKKLENKVFLGK